MSVKYRKVEQTKWEVLDDGIVFAIYNNEEEAKQVCAGLSRANEMGEFVSYRLYNIVADLRDKYNVLDRHEAFNMLKEQLDLIGE